MLTLPLEPTDDLANPIFKDAASCAHWVSQLQLTNLQLAHSILLTQLNELNRFPMRGLERLETLEVLRETIGYVQDDYARKLIAKPLPLNDSELLVFAAITQLWQAMVLGYQRCLQAFMAGDSQLAIHGALLCQRCLLYSGLEIFEHLRSGYEFDAGLWHQLHELYGFAESQGLQLDEVDDPLNSVQPHTSCRTTYVKTLLACYARPAELTRSQLQWMDRWLARWGNDVTVERSYAASRGDAQPLAVDLAGTQGLQNINQVAALTRCCEASGAGEAASHPLPQSAGCASNVSRDAIHSDSIRYLAMVPVSKLLRVKIILLQQGQSPQQLDLGNYRNTEDCIRLLTFLLQCWCEDRNRVDERHPVVQDAQLCYGMEGIYAHIAGQTFRQPKHRKDISNTARKQIEAFGRVLQDKKGNEQLEAEFPLESWQLENESILGARLVREETFGERLSPNQLIALRPAGAETFMPGVTVWANVKCTGKLQIGVRYLPGVAEAVSVRATGVNMTVSDKYVPAFLLQAAETFKTQASLIVPHGWFRPGRVVEVLHQNDEVQNVKMGISVERGIGYERISFTPI